MSGSMMKIHIPVVLQGGMIAVRKGHQIDPAKLDDYMVVLKDTGNGFEKVNDLPGDLTNGFYAFEVLHESPGGWYGGFSYVDLLIPGVTEKFIELTMTGYE